MGGQPQPGLLQGRSATAWPPSKGRLVAAKAPTQEATSCGQPVGAASTCKHGRLQREGRQRSTRKGLLAC
ncbi:hypothetical protein BHM03_00023428, partial [Ensete ventricosum]